MYSALAAFTSSPISLQVTTKASVFFFIVRIVHHQHEPEADVYHVVSSHPGLPEPS